MSNVIELKGGHCTTDPRLDRIKEVDLRSLGYRVSSMIEGEGPKKPRGYSWRVDERLDQGREGACVGFGWAHELAARPAEVADITNEFARNKIYLPAQRIDEWEGGAYPGASPFYEGTSVLAGAKVVQQLGFIKNYYWALHVHELISGVGYFGPCVIGVDWYQGMFNTDADGFIHPTGSIGGGHCVTITGVKIVKLDKRQRHSYENIDFLRSYFRIINSWGADWGQNGTCKITFAELLKLWPGGDFVFAAGRTKEGFETDAA